jgi:hypothetical protein
VVGQGLVQQPVRLQPAAGRDLEGRREPRRVRQRPRRLEVGAQVLALVARPGHINVDPHRRHPDGRCGVAAGAGMFAVVSADGEVAVLIGADRRRDGLDRRAPRHGLRRQVKGGDLADDVERPQRP